MERALRTIRTPGTHTRDKPHSHLAMSLVEVTLALGITSFAAIVIMGLMATALGQNSESSEKADIVKIYQNVSESIKTLADNAPPADSWQGELVYSREAIACEPSDTNAHYRATISALPSATWTGNASTNAWNIRVQILNIPKQRLIFQRGTIFVKSPPGNVP